MGKHLGLKAFVLLVVIFFHSFVLVPKSYSGTVVDMAAARVFFRAVAPSVVAATPAGVGYWIGVAVTGAVVYYALKSSGVSTMKTWLTTNQPQYIKPASGQTQEWGPFANGYSVKAVATGTPTSYAIWFKHTVYFGGNWQWYASTQNFQDVINYIISTSGGGGVSPPTTPQDYQGALLETMPSFPSGSLYISPGGAALIAANGGGGPIVKAEQKTDAELDLLKGALSMTSPDPDTGVQPNPTANDNTLSPGENLTVPLLQQMLNFLSNLVGIKSDTERIADTLDNVATSLASGTETEPINFDNVIGAINAQSEIDNAILAKTDNVIQSIESLKGTETTQGTLSARIGEVKDLLLTKFPFSIVAAVTSPGEVSGGTYSIPDLHFPLGLVVSVDPMENEEISSWVSWLRGLMAVGMWAIFVLVMVRRVTEI